MAIARALKAVSYGPFGAIQSAIIGFIAGTAVFLLRDAFIAEHNVVVELPLLLTVSIGVALAVLTVAMVANYVIGRRIRDEIELRAMVAAGQAVLVPTPRDDLPGIDLLARSGTNNGEAGTRKAEARTREMA